MYTIRIKTNSQKTFNAFETLLILFPLKAGREEDFSGIENDTLPDFTQLEHFINSDNDEQNE